MSQVMTAIVASTEGLCLPSTLPNSESRKVRERYVSSTGHSKAHVITHLASFGDLSYVLEATTTIRKGVELGSGGFARVFRAIQNDTKSVVAVKQSRISLQLNRPSLQHEARVLKLLSGHPGIPEVYAYGRIEHFELISMQLLHRSLRNAVEEDGLMSVKTVANIAYQMMDALQHVHAHGLVHRDIKPDNIMLRSPGSWKLCLIDFGLTRRLPSSVASTTPTLLDSVPDRSAYVFGTLPFASLNAQEKDPQLTFRDDIESLAYTLLWLLRGNLPWCYYTKCGNPAGRIRQVHAQKKRHNGSTLGSGLPAEFGELVDYARFLLLAEQPGYNGWRRRFKQVEESTTETDVPILQHQAPEVSVARPEPPVEVGQIVLVRLDPFVTGDGYTIREGHESSFIPDPFYDSPEWSTRFKPAVVARVEWDERAQKYNFLAIAISRSLDHDTVAVSINTNGSNVLGAPLVAHIEPNWPLDASFFYVFKRPTRFYCLPSQSRIQSTWKVAVSDCDSLLNALTPPPDTISKSQEKQDLKSSDPDTRHDARMRRWAVYCKLYAHIEPLTLAHLDNDSVDWLSKRAWFDECVKIQRHKNLHGGFWWTGAWFPSVYRRKEGDLRNSYLGSEFYIWQPQADRRRSITLAANGENTSITGDVLAGLTKIVGLEKEPQAQNA
ncbi:unnamed protein product [Rhizoctonia solani]|uniref:non-specific serine/threonine protein kinase n=1 Tax=Rhizoctonia solani TaxID=456999 RepID=A0A8H3I2X2_9AGAM|nr:unnamed protein product [Rhizoctonia solani]